MRRAVATLAQRRAGVQRGITVWKRSVQEIHHEAKLTYFLDAEQGREVLVGE